MTDVSLRRISRPTERRGEANIFVAGSTCIKKDDQLGSLKKLKAMEDEINGILQ